MTCMLLSLAVHLWASLDCSASARRRHHLRGAMAFDDMRNFDRDSHIAIFLFVMSLKFVRTQGTGCGRKWSTLCERLSFLEDNDQEAANSAGNTKTKVEEHDNYINCDLRKD